MTSIKQLTEQTDVMRSMIQSMKPNQSSSAVAHPLGELLGQLDRVEKGQPATRRQEGRQTTLPEALGNKPSPGVLRALDQVLSHARANEGDHDDPTSLSMHPRLKSPTSAKKTSVSSTKKVDEVIDLDPDSPQKSSSGAHPAWTNNMKMESAEEAKFEDNIDDSDAIHGNSGKARQMRGGMLEESNDEERGTGRRGQLEVGNLPTSNRMRYNLDDQHLGMSNSRISNIVNRMYSHADYEEREVSDRAFNNIFNMNIGASIPEGIEGEDSDDSYEEGDDDTLPGKRKMKTTMTGAPATRKGRRSSSDASQQRDGLGDSSPSVMGVMKDAMCKGVSRTVSYFMGSSQQPANNKDTTGGSAQVSAKKPAPLVMATPLVSAAMMHSAQQQGQSLRSSGRKSKGDDGDGVVDLT
ncbi:hypothetical protein EON65_31215 [archaeon]|nr:MAG: hypothetical protein EON65_31215 [archaeon]